MKEIPLTKGQVALVDDEDYERVAAMKWHAREASNGNGFYAVTSASRRAKRPRYYLHRFILNAPKGLEVDHKDHNGLHCWRDNLRLATRVQNGSNQRKSAVNTSGFKGVGRRKSTWRAVIIVRQKQIGRYGFATPEEAARAYDELAIQYHGEFACLNFPLEKM